jgi:hypothetical protein
MLFVKRLPPLIHWPWLETQKLGLIIRFYKHTNMIEHSHVQIISSFHTWNTVGDSICTIKGIFIRTVNAVKFFR